MQPVPDYRAHKTKNVSDHGCENDQSKSSYRIEWFNDINRLDHVRPEDEIDDGLRPTQQHETRPNDATLP